MYSRTPSIQRENSFTTPVTGMACDSHCSRPGLLISAKQFLLFLENFEFVPREVSCHCKEGLRRRGPWKFYQSDSSREWELQLCKAQYHPVFSNLSMSKINFFSGCLLLLLNIYYLLIITSITWLVTTHLRNTKSVKDKTLKTLLKHLRHICSYWEAAKWTMLAEYLEKEGKEVGTSFSSGASRENKSTESRKIAS